MNNVFRNQAFHFGFADI